MSTRPLPTEEQLSTPEFKVWYANFCAAPRTNETIAYMFRHIPKTDSTNPAYAMALDAMANSLPPSEYASNWLSALKQVQIR